VIGNPPFLGGSKKRGELGDKYFDALNAAYDKRVPGGADLVCYWFDKALTAIRTNGLGATGLVATQSIRAGSNRAVLTAICAQSRIYEAWSDEPWVNDGASVRVSMVCFGHAAQVASLDGNFVSGITADLSNSSIGDLTQASVLNENAQVIFKGAEKSGSFEINGLLARQWLAIPNPHSLSNSVVLKPWRNGADITDRPVDHWIIDFGVDTPVSEAVMYEQPFTYILQSVKPARDANNDRGRRENWWRFGRNGADMRKGIASLTRFIVTTRVSKHRFFTWLQSSVSADSRLAVIAREDDCTFGLLSSRIHEVWSLANASMHGVGNDPTYNAKSCFETFPFPAGLTPRDTAHGAPDTPVAQAIAAAAKRLNELRENWLNPPEWTRRVPEIIPLGMSESPYPDRTLPKPSLNEADMKALQKRTLTNLYNQRPAWLEAAHKALDAAVATAYGWSDYTAEMADEDILARLLKLNHERAATQGSLSFDAAKEDKPKRVKRKPKA
jgi:type II restriction/modification system DNA methylase subunit YeeA